MPLQVGVIGCGAIGSALAKFVQKELRSQARVRCLFDIDRTASLRLARSLGRPLIAGSLKEIIRKSDFLIEAASVECARALIPIAIQHHRPALLISGGGLILEPKLMKKILSGCNKFYLPSGAVSGVDGLLASREAGLKKVTLTTSKSLRSLGNAPFFDLYPEKKIFSAAKKVIFEGSVVQAIKYFPKNLNVAALLALAGFGPRKTKVRVVAYRRLAKNIHEIEIESSAGKIVLKTENLPHKENPSTSALAIYSAQTLLRKLFHPLSLGT